MSSYLVVGGFVHSCGFNRNQFRVLIDWFDFIHRCFFHSRWSSQNQVRLRCNVIQNQAVNLWLRIVQWLVIDQEHFDWMLVCLFVSNRFLIPMHDSIIIKISILPAWLRCFLCHFCNDTELGLLFQSYSHSFRSLLLLLPMTHRSHIEHSQMTVIPIYQSYQNDGLN